ncbi:MAG: hypothetical protein GX625_00130 [Clostridiaceae bacterium]|nr:hypothetical protein [Clostridiaceae bacterium]
MADIKWIKLSVGLFSNRKIKQIRKLPEGDAIIGVWLQILCLAGQTNDNGMVYFSKDIPYTEEMLATEFDRHINIVKIALRTLEGFKMIEVIDNILLVSNWEKYQSADRLEKIREQNRIRQQNFRDKQKQLTDSNVTHNVTITQSNATELELDKEEELELEYRDKSIEIRDKNIEKKKSIRNKRLFVEDSIEFQLSKKLLDYILINNPNYKMPNLQNWAKHIDYMIRLDKRTPEQINDIIVFSQEDSFWKSNVLSTEKLRQKFDQLWIKKKNGKPKSTFEILQAEYEKEVESEQNRNHQITGSN